MNVLDRMKSIGVLKKFIAISAVLLCCTVSVSCDEISTPIIEEPTPTVGEKSNDYIYIWTDDETGVQYVIYREKTYNAGHGGITPRLNPDGSLYGVETTTHDDASHLNE